MWSGIDRAAREVVMAHDDTPISTGMFAPDVWTRPPRVPLDLHGPSDLPYEPPAADFVDRPVYTLFESVAARHADRLAVCDLARRMTFAELHAETTRLAIRIARRVPPGQCIGVLLPVDVRLPVAILACLATGRTCLLFDLHHPADRIASSMRDAGLAAVIHAPDVPLAGTAIPHGVERLPLPAVSHDTPEPLGWHATPEDADAPAIVVFTSGSTGQPKGIVHSQRAVLCRARQMIDAWHLRPDDVLASLSTLTTIAGITCFPASLLTGGAQLVVDVLRDGLGRVLALAGREHASIMVGFPDLLRGITRLSDARTRLATLRVIRTAGGALLASDVTAWRALLPPGCHIMTTLGSTEMMTFAQRFVPPDIGAEPSPLPAGYPLPDHEYFIADEQYRPVPAGTMGELVIRSRNIASGEWVGGACTPGRLPPDTSEPALRVLCTGDIVGAQPDGTVRFIGRRDNQVKVRGQRVEPAEIEATLRDVPGIAGASVVAESDGGDVSLTAFIVPGEDASDDRVALARAAHDALSQRLPRYMQPSRIVCVAALVRLPSGKIDTRAMLAACDAPTTKSVRR